MTTAYTSLLGLALPVTGELSGTWGDTVNNSITSLIDSAIAGTTTLSTDADVTLTTTTGAANTSREAILLCSGARTGIKTITAPAQTKIYTIINSTTGGYAVKIVGVGPTTGLTIPNGSSAVVAWNGSDFIEIGSSTVGNFTVNGNLTVTGTSTLTGTASLAANLTFTGTGNRITGDFSNATTASRVAFQSSTTNTNTSLMVLPNGTATIAGADLFNNSDTTNAAYFSMQSRSTESRLQTTITGTGTYVPMTFYTGGSERARIDTSGNVGIGTSSPTSKLQVAGSGFFTSRSVPTSGAGPEIYYDGTSAGWLAYNRTSSAYIASTYDALSHQWAISGGEGMRILSGGNVGIGTATPANKLEISGGSIRTINNTSGRITFNNGTTEAYVGFNGSGQTILDSGALPLTINSQGANYIVLNTNSTERMRIDSSGNVGIGTSSPANGRLDVVTSSGAAYVNIRRNSQSTGEVGLTLYGGTSSNNWTAYMPTSSNDFRLNTAGVDRLTVDSSGNVGIGVTPSTKLDVNGAITALGGNSPTGGFNLRNVAGTVTPRITNDGADGTVIRAGASGASVKFNNFANTTEMVLIDSSGNVSIGTSSPTAGYGVLQFVGGASGSLISTTDAGLNIAQYNGESYLISYATLSTSGSWTARSTSSSAISSRIGTIVFTTNTGLTSGSSFSPTERMRIDSSGNVGIGTTTPSASAILDAQSTTKGVRMPNMTTTQKNAISSPAAGLMVFDTTLSKLCVYSGAAWQTITSV